MWKTSKKMLLATLFLSSCGMELKTTFEGVEAIVEENQVHIGYVGSRPYVIDDSSGDTVPPPPAKSKAVLTFYGAEDGTMKKIVTVEEGEPLSVTGLPDGNYKLVTEFRETKTHPPSVVPVTVVDGKFTGVELNTETVGHDHFYYEWESSLDGYEYEYSLNDELNQEIEFLGEEIETVNNTAAQKLYKDYNIILGDDGLDWTYDLAAKLLKAVELLPHKKLKKTAKFVISEKHQHRGIQFAKEGGHDKVTLSFSLFANASEKLVKLNGKRGHFYSYELFKALVYFFTNDGKNTHAVKKILDEKFGVTTDVPNYSKLTGENKHNFQGFHSNELVNIIHAFSEMPSGYYRIPGLRYLLRRKDGHPHPIYPQAAAVAWPRGRDNNSYIEFMDVAFIQGTEEYTHRLVLHEKSHFLWRNVFSNELKKSWIKLGKWVEDSSVPSGWTTTDTTRFVSAYAHGINPNEDMAESLSYYVLNPNKLLSLAPDKFDFIKNNIMNGYRYVTAVRDDLTFEVLNLYPDYDFPGKIKRVVVRAEGDPDEDKKVTITIELMNKEGIQDGAERAFARIRSPKGSFKDVYFYSSNDNKHRLEGTFTVSKNDKRGYWKTESITVRDLAGNERHERSALFGFKLYINNRIEDLHPPEYVSDSLAINSSEAMYSDKKIFHVDLKWKINENQEMREHSPVYASLISLDHGDRYAIGNYGSFNKETSEAYVRILLTHFFRGGRYGVSYIKMFDKASNTGDQYFSDNPKHEPVKYTSIVTKNPDSQSPILDTNRITVQAAPLNPIAPDGSTRINIEFYAKDDKSGVGIIFYKLLDPLGKVHFNYYVHSNFYTRFFIGDPTVYRRYLIETTLPKGSAPGRWGLMELGIQDKARNRGTYNFTETMHFRIGN